MPKSYSVRFVIKVLESKGFSITSQKGSHAKFRNNAKPVRTVIVPIHGKEVPHGTFRSILRQSGLKDSDFSKE